MYFSPRLLPAGKIGLDLCGLSSAYCLVIVLFQGSFSPPALGDPIGSLPLVILVKYVCLFAYRVPNLTWRYFSLHEASRLWTALVLSSLLLGAPRIAHAITDSTPLLPSYVLIPPGVLLVDFVFSFVCLTGLRVAWRLGLERSKRRSIVARPKVPTLFVGAGFVGVHVSKEVQARPDIGMHPVGFIDDDPNKVGTIINGIPVLGSTAAVGRIAQESGAEQALITIGRLSGEDIRRIAQLCAACGLRTKIIPALGDILNGRVNLSRIRDVAIEDLLRRPPTRLDGRAIAGIIRGRTVVVTGAGGSIGSELCREVCRFGPAALVLIEQAENSLFHVHRRLAQEFPNVRLAPCIGDICDRERVTEIFGCHRPDLVFHAAAHKHVPLMEDNPGEAVKNNVLGTKTVALLAHSFGVTRFVMISTDKAVNPTSVMGVSKRVAEIYIKALSGRSSTRFVTVRFGNVLGSAGSVVPIFKEQITRGGPVTVTHPEMRRFFMTIPEACQLVLQAASMGRGGEIFILNMGEPVKIVDLAHDLIRLSGFSPDEIEIRFTGMRPGEKLYEELSLEEERPDKTSHPSIFIGRLRAPTWVDIEQQIDELRAVADCPEVGRILAKFKEIVPEFRSSLPMGQDPSSAQGADGQGRQTAWHNGRSGVPDSELVIAARRGGDRRRDGERRKADIPVPVERRSGQDRRQQNRVIRHPPAGNGTGPHHLDLPSHAHNGTGSAGLISPGSQPAPELAGP